MTGRGRGRPVRVVPPTMPPVPAGAVVEGGSESARGKPVDAVLAVAMRTYLRETGGRGAGQVSRNWRGKWYGTLRVGAARLASAGVDVVAYVTFVVRRCRRRGGQDPWPLQVLGADAVLAWLPIYRSAGRGEVRPWTLRLPPSWVSSYRQAMKGHRVGR